MDTIKAGTPTIELAKLCYAANRPLMLSGRHGIGKSELLERAAKDLGIDYVTRDLSLMEAVDLTGMPRIDGAATKYVPPTFLPTSGNGFLVFEELNRCDRFVRTPCLQLATARSLNDYQLPNGWLPVAAINPADADYEVFELDVAMLSRFVQVTVVPDQAEWLQWAARNNIHPAVLDYARSDTTIFDSPDSNPRAWKYVSDVLHVADKGASDSKTLRAAVVGLVGDKRGVAFLRTLKQTERPLTADKVLDSYSQHRAEVTAWVQEGRTDLLEKTLLAIEKHVQPKSDYDQVRSARKRWGNLGTFLGDLPGDLREQAESWLKERDYEIPQQTKKKVKKT